MFVDVNCPVCGVGDARVLRQSCYPRDVSIEEMEAMYSASSDRALMDRVVECRNCGMVYLSPRLDAGLIQKGYESAEDPTFIAQNPQRIRAFVRSVRSILARTGLRPVGRRILDIGCAGGAFLVAARDAGFDVVGLEPCRWLGEYARKEYGLDVRQGVLRPGLFPPSSFDVISLWDVMEHVPDPHAALATVRSLLKDDGYLWISFPDIGSTAARLLRWKWPFWLSVHLHYYRRVSMCRQLEAAGFKVRYTRPHWPQLQFGYVLKRAAALVPPLKPLAKVVSAIGLGSVPFSYNMGQTLMVARPEGK
jgi:SAM-dependent methyltransferase